MSYNPNNSNGQKTMANSAPVVIASDQSAVPISSATLATTAKQDTGNTSVASIDTKTPALGQALAAASVPVVLTAAQITTLTPVSTVTANAGTNLNTSALALDATLTGGTQQTKITDGTNVATVKAASTAAVAADKAVVVALSPNNSVVSTVADITATGNITTQNLVPAGTATANSAVETATLNGQTTLTVQVTGTYTGALSLQGTVDGTNWITIATGVVFINVNTGTTLATITSALVGIFQTDCAGMNKVRITGLAAMSGTATVTMRASVGTGVVALDMPIPAGTAIIGALSANQSVNVAQFNGVTPLMGAGNNGTGAQRVSIATDQTAVTTAGVFSVKVDQTTVGTTNAVSLAQIGATTVVNGGVAGTLAVGGVTAAAATSTGNPVRGGAIGKTANPTAVTDGQVANFITDKLGKQVVVGSIRDLKANQITTITASTSETTVVTAVASTFMDVYGCIVVNSSATAANVSFKDSTAGTTRFNIYVPAGDTRGFMLNESAAFAQTTVNNNWTATSSASVSSLIITMLTVKNT